MPDYKAMYLTLFRAMEQAANILIAAQQECEDHYLSSGDPELTVIPLPIEYKKSLKQHCTK